MMMTMMMMQSMRQNWSDTFWALISSVCRSLFKKTPLIGLTGVLISISYDLIRYVPTLRATPADARQRLLHGPIRDGVESFGE